MAIADSSRPSGQRVEFKIGSNPRDAPTAASDGTVGRLGGRCFACATSVPLPYIREQGRAGRMACQLMAIVAEGNRQRVYLPPNEVHVKAALVERPENVPDGELPHNPRDFKTPNYFDLKNSKQLPL